MREEKKTQKGFLNNKKKIGIASTIVLAATIGGGLYVSNVNENIEEWKHKIYPGVTMNGVDLSGKSKDEAKKLLEENLNKKIGEKEIIIKAGDKEYKDKYKSIDAKYNVEKAAEEALNYKKDTNIFSQNSAIKNANTENLDVEFLYDDKKIENLNKKASEALGQKAKNATINIVGDKKNITEEQVGKKIDQEKLKAELVKELNGDLSKATTLNIQYIEDKPKVTKEDLSKIKGVMGSFESSFASSNPGRAANIRAAVGFVDGTVLMPGEVFSYDKATSSDKSKYHQAPVYINNKIEMDIGGGICQVSSALYRSIMNANIRPVERHNHSLTVGYAKPSLDATVAWGYLDLKIKNPYDFPIYIKGTSDGKVIRFSVYGDPAAKGGKTYEMQNEIIKTIPPKEKIVKDPTLEEGKRKVVSKGQAGYVSKGYQLTYENGKLIKKELISTDTYATTETVVHVGTKKPEAPPAPPVPPAPQVEPEVAPASV